MDRSLVCGMGSAVADTSPLVPPMLLRIPDAFEFDSFGPPLAACRLLLSSARLGASFAGACGLASWDPGAPANEA